MNIIKELIKVVIIGIILIAGVSLVFAWTGPPYQGVCSDPPCPPGGNVPAPINTGGASQRKTGALGIGGVFQVSSLPNCNTIDTDGSGNLMCGTDDVGGGGGGGGIGGSGTANYLAKWTAGTTLGNSTIFDNGNVGIGAASRGARLDVPASLGITAQFGNIYIDATNPNHIKSTGSIALNSPGGGLALMTGNSVRLWADSSGNIGIGTEIPGKKLDVQGGSIKTSGKLGTNGYDPDSGYPPGWGGGIHTWDVYAEGSIKAKGDICTDQGGGKCLSTAGGGGFGYKGSCNADNSTCKCNAGENLMLISGSEGNASCSPPNCLVVNQNIASVYGRSICGKCTFACF